MKYELEESILQEAAALSGPNSNFHKVLKWGEEIRSTGLTPIYIYDDVLGACEVTTEEKISNKLN